ncbi:MAG: class I SAM-dependent methyltransferase [Dehalococcoidales bacterium]|jgi:ubiquinone/menaquinone biosynthesis C-methylase UbiE|nr:class I SAM-dependent methyltransferase [Dehalococcoidales bacterium]MDD4793942.1 class I SAM-dependent methyltransferase [Dehalococcoidales bacterium]MDD5122284.1 class I SAM-dependent methyltransferase [Dehalococcoidales bacterium]MDD5498173.1 class I SAM-dependent methyltransferase [Dehalococcoidales bacterium]
MNMNVVEKWMVNRSTTGKSGQKLAKKLLTHINTDPSQRFLDIGCGQGVITRYLAINYPGEFTGIDLDELEIEAARAKPKLENLSYQVGDARALPFEERSFDVVMALGVLHHIPDWYKAVSEIGRILKVGGYFISAELVYPQWVTSMDEKSSFKFGIYDLDIARLVRMIQDEGFITLHNEENKRLLWKDFQAVFEKKYEKAFSRV